MKSWDEEAREKNRKQKQDKQPILNWHGSYKIPTIGFVYEK